MKKVKVVLLILVIITAAYSLYYTINKIIDSKSYAIVLPENNDRLREIDERDGIINETLIVSDEPESAEEIKDSGKTVS